VLASGLRGHRCIILLLARSVCRPFGPHRRRSLYAMPLMLEAMLPLALVLLTLAAVPLVDDVRGQQQ
jgi:hypothetical protein